MPGYWKKCEWCDGTKMVFDVIVRTFVYCLQCAGLGEKWVEIGDQQERGNDGAKS